MDLRPWLAIFDVIGVSDKFLMSMCVSGTLSDAGCWMLMPQENCGKQHVSVPHNPVGGEGHAGNNELRPKSGSCWTGQEHEHVSDGHVRYPPLAASRRILRGINKETQDGSRLPSPPPYPASSK